MDGYSFKLVCLCFCCRRRSGIAYDGYVNSGAMIAPIGPAEVFDAATSATISHGDAPVL